MPHTRLTDRFSSRESSHACASNRSPSSSSTRTATRCSTRIQKTTPEFLEKGLANRRFVGLSFSDQTVSPLEWLANLLQIPQKDVESRQSTFRLHHYSPAEQVLGTRDGSWEAQLEFLLESPAGVKYIVKYSRVFARGPLESLFVKEPYTLLVQCNISLK